MSGLGIVTASADVKRAEPCLASWLQHAVTHPQITCVPNAYLGAVRAFARGVDEHLEKHPDSEVICCFHDDLVIFEQGWDQKVLDAFADPGVGLAGFGGWMAIGATDLYDAEYDPLALAGFGYRSNQTDAERHGTRSTDVEPVVAVSAFSQIGRRAFFSGFREEEWRTKLSRRKRFLRPWVQLDDWRMVDHFYAQALGCLARRHGWRVLSLPARCRHLGGHTTNDLAYHEWADHEMDGGDRGIWEAAHRIGYEQFKDVLPLRL